MGKYFNKNNIPRMDEEQPMMMEEGAAMDAKMEGMEEEEIDEVKQKLADGGFMCCCCLCQCTDSKVKDLSCCCFFPIRCGVLFIGCFILAITLFVFLEIFYELLNDDIHWWYVLVGVVLASTLIIASSFTVVFFTKDTDSSRSNMRVACILVIIGVSLVAIWSACYFIWLYKKDTVTTGNDGVGFVKATRKQEVVVTLYIACCIDALFAYFLCVIAQYIDAMKEEEEVPPMEDPMMAAAMEDMMDKMMEDKMSSGSKKSKKSNMSKKSGGSKKSEGKPEGE